ncbi:nuclear condensing complex subunit [Mycena crocata]|nr:nuclear condensing complex subunit [Mycena crocata]
MPARTLPVVDLQTAVPRIFDQVQTSAANHQKNLVALHKLHLEAAKKTENGGTKLTGEQEFDRAFRDMLSRVLPMKKGVAAADRVVKFVGGYTKFVNDRAAEDRVEENDEVDTDTTASRFTAKLLQFLLKGFQAKDKYVRYRVIFIAAEMISHLGEMDDEIYAALRVGLLDRIHDRESIIRVQVVLALAKLAGSDDPPEGEQTVLQVLLDTLSSDTSADVRRAALVNIPVGPDSLPALLARSRDTETVIRKLLYSTVLEGAATDSAKPSTLTIAQRELVVRNGLGDREHTVRAAAATLIGTWIDVIGDKIKPEQELASRLGDVDIAKDEEKTPLGAEEKQRKTIETFTTFLRMFDPDIFEDLHFGDMYFANLTAEKIFLARVFVDHCVADKGRGEQKMETAGIPVVTSCAFRIQDGFNALAEDAARQYDDQDEKEESRREKELIVGEMLKLAVNLDYADEIGRRKMFSLVRDMLTRPALPLGLVPRCLDVLRQLSPNERELIRVVVEIVQDLREPGDEEDDLGAADQTQETINPDGDADTSFDSEKATKKPARAREDMSPEEQQRVDSIDMRCLSLCVGMLERVNGTLDENSMLQGILTDLIIPSVKRKENDLREHGLAALGLFCLIAKRLALSSLPLFISQAKAEVPEVLKIKLLHIIFDLLMVHEQRILAPGSEDAENMTKFLVTELETESNKNDTSPKVLATLSTGIAKLLLSAMITDPKAVKSLLTVYFSPYNADNQELKQCLAFFAPVYSHSSAINQRVMRDIFIDIFQKFSKLRQDMDDEDDVINLSQVASMWLHWTDPSQVLDPNGQPGHAGKAGDPLIQFDLADDIIRALLKDNDMQKDDKKILVQMLGKLYIPDEVDVDKVRTLKLLMHTLLLRRPLQDATTNTAFKKFEASISKKFQKELEDFNEEEYRKLEELKDLFEFLDDIIPEEEDEVIKTDTKKKGKKRRSDSIISMTTDGDDVSVASSRREKSKPKTKRRRLSTSDDEESDFDDDDRTAKGTPPPPTRTLPKRSAAARKEVIVISSDDDEDEDDATPIRKGRSRVVSGGTRNIKEEARIDADIDDLLDEEASSEIPHDSIMDDSDEEDEVNDLLVED